MQAEAMIKLSGLASRLGKLSRDFQSASPSQRIILQIQMDRIRLEMQAVTNARKEWQWKA